MGIWLQRRGWVGNWVQRGAGESGGCWMQGVSQREVGVAECREEVGGGWVQDQAGKNLGKQTGQLRV